MDPDSLIKADSERVNTPIAFQFRDVRALAFEMLKRANNQAQRKLEAAGKQAEDIEKAAYDDGYQKGHAEGYAKGEPEGRDAGDKAAREAFAERTRGVSPVLEQLLHELEARKVELRSQAEADLMHLALAIARRIVRREIEIHEAHVLPTVREAIGLATDRSDLMIRAHPADVAAIDAELPSLRAAFTDMGRVYLEEDPELGRGEIRILGVEGEIDMRLEQQFGAIERALLGLGVEEEPDPAAEAVASETVPEGPQSGGAEGPPLTAGQAPPSSAADEADGAASAEPPAGPETA